MSRQAWDITVFRRRTDQPEVQRPVTYEVQSMSFAAQMGPDMARFRVAGKRNAVANWINYLRRGIEIVNQDGEVAWWGYVHDVALYLDGQIWRVSLDDLVTRARVAYTLRGENFVTDEAIDSGAVNDYGDLELLYSPGLEMSEGAAEALRDNLLDQRSDVRATPSLGSSDVVYADVTARGWLFLLQRSYYIRSFTPISTGDTASDSITMGHRVTGADIVQDAKLQRISSLLEFVSYWRVGDILRFIDNANADTVRRVVSPVFGADAPRVVSSTTVRVEFSFVRETIVTPINEWVLTETGIIDASRLTLKDPSETTTYTEGPSSDYLLNDIADAAGCRLIFRGANAIKAITGTSILNNEPCIAEYQYERQIGATAEGGYEFDAVAGYYTIYDGDEDIVGVRVGKVSTGSNLGVPGSPTLGLAPTITIGSGNIVPGTMTVSPTGGGDSYEEGLDWWCHYRTGNVAVQPGGSFLADFNYDYLSTLLTEGAGNDYTVDLENKQILLLSGGSYTPGEALAVTFYILKTVPVTMQFSAYDVAKAVPGANAFNMNSTSSVEIWSNDYNTEYTSFSASRSNGVLFITPSSTSADVPLNTDVFIRYREFTGGRLITTTTGEYDVFEVGEAVRITHSGNDWYTFVEDIIKGDDGTDQLVVRDVIDIPASVGTTVIVRAQTTQTLDDTIEYEPVTTNQTIRAADVIGASITAGANYDGISAIQVTVEGLDSPTDSVQAELWDGNELLTSGTLDADASGGLAAVWIPVSPSVALSNGTTYRVTIRRSGAGDNNQTAYRVGYTPLETGTGNGFAGFILSETDQIVNATQGSSYALSKGYIYPDTVVVTPTGGGPAYTLGTDYTISYGAFVFLDITAASAINGTDIDIDYEYVEWSSYDGFDVPVALDTNVQTSEQIETVLSDVDSDIISNTIVRTPSFLYTNPAQDGTATHYEVLMQLMNTGTASNKRYVLEITQDRVAIVDAEETYNADGALLYREDGTIQEASGVPIPLWRCYRFVRSWLRYWDIPLDIPVDGVREVYIEGAEYDAVGDRVRLQTRGVESVWSVLTNRQG